MTPDGDDFAQLQTFIVELGAWAVAIGVLCGTLILEGGEVTERAVATVAKSVRENTSKLLRFRR